MSQRQASQKNSRHISPRIKHERSRNRLRPAKHTELSVRAARWMSALPCRPSAASLRWLDRGARRPVRPGVAVFGKSEQGSDCSRVCHVRHSPSCCLRRRRTDRPFSCLEHRDRVFWRASASRNASGYRPPGIPGAGGRDRRHGRQGIGFACAQSDSAFRNASAPRTRTRLKPPLDQRPFRIRHPRGVVHGHELLHHHLLVDGLGVLLDLLG